MSRSDVRLQLVRESAERSLAATAAAGRDEVWICRVAEREILAEADRIDDAVGSGHDLPLAGLTFAVKDNIDVAGIATTAGCPAFAYVADTDAPAVRSLREAGALFLGKTNLDQFATGLVGTRSPFGAVRCAADPARISGGSSSGSAVAVALGEADLALGTDTAGSGRVPAALNGIVGLKPTRGLVSTAGVVPACRSFDSVSVFAPDVDLAERAMAELAGPRGGAAGRRAFPADSPLGPPQRPVIARPSDKAIGQLAPGWLEAYGAVADRLVGAGCDLVEIDLEPFMAAGRLLYEGAFVAERHAAVGTFVETHADEVDPTVGQIIASAGRIGAGAYIRDMERLLIHTTQAAAAWRHCGAQSLLLPTTTHHPTLDEVARDPVGVNAELGRFTTFLNLLDMCAVAVPGPPVAGLPFGVSCMGPAFSDLVQLDIARRVVGEGIPASATWTEARLGRLSPPGVLLAVVGAHLSGQPLNHQLTERGGRLLGPALTASCYRLHVLATDPPKPGLRRVAAGGDSVAAEIWELPPVAFAEFVAAVPAPMAIGPVLLENGTSVPGFLCEPVALHDAPDITVHGGWRDYLAGCTPAQRLAGTSL
jgi:allophanate hydrolase